MTKIVNNKLLWFVFIIYIAIFTTIDYLNMPYTQMAQMFSWGLVFFNILLNGVMSGLSAYLFGLHEDIFKQFSTSIKGANAPILASLFGVLTYGCTPCVISFFAMIGINFSIMSLPWAGLPYKFISLLILLIGVWFAIHQSKKACSI